MIITERSLNVRSTFSLSRDILRSIAREEDAAGAAVDVVDVVDVDVVVVVVVAEQTPLMQSVPTSQYPRWF